MNRMRLRPPKNLSYGTDLMAGMMQLLRKPEKKEHLRTRSEEHMNNFRALRQKKSGTIERQKVKYYKKIDKCNTDSS